MSRFTEIPAGASLERYAVSELTTTDDGTPARLHVALWEGRYSQGYKSGYERVPTRWLVIEARGDDGRLLRYGTTRTPRRHCKQFTGQRFDKALRDFEMIVKRDGLTEPGAADASRYYHQVQGRYLTHSVA